MDRYQKIIFLVLFFIGIVIPFTPLCVIEAFLIIPIVLVFAFSVLWLIVSFFTKSPYSKDALFMFLIVPVFVLSQVLSVFIVDRVQLVRGRGIIADLEEAKQRTGNFPKEFDVRLGIDYEYDPVDDDFSISYSRGFLVTERYDSTLRKWASYGWND